jgi:hypothetical protein
MSVLSREDNVIHVGRTELLFAVQSAMFTFVTVAQLNWLLLEERAARHVKKNLGSVHYALTLNFYPRRLIA